MLKDTLKKIIPAIIRAKIRAIEARVFGVDRKYRGLSSQEVFDGIYKSGTWGRDGAGNSTSGSGSHSRAVVDPYVEAVKLISEKKSTRSAVDLGCGDFAVGSRVFNFFERYIACDISEVILERNREAYARPSLEFRKINLAKDELPEADIAFVRQVLQHLSNREIKSFVDQVNSKRKFKYLLVTEHLPLAPGFIPNKDKPTGPGIRVILNSGVVLHQEPFNLRYRDFEDVLSVNEDSGVLKEVIKTTLYTL